MNIADMISSEFTEFDVGTPVSKLSGAFDDPSLKAVLVVDDGEYEGVVTRRQLASSHREPNAKIGSLVWHVPTVERTEDVREVARLMVGSDSKVLPVVEGSDLEGVVTADDLLEAVKSNFGVIEVRHVYSDDLVTIDSGRTLGDVLHVLRENGITHVPVVDGDDLRGIVSLHDIMGFVTRPEEKSSGGEGDFQTGRSHGGFGAREGERAKMLDLPISDLMTDTVGTTTRETPLDEALDEMLEMDASSLVVVDANDAPTGIVTKTDILQSLTWEVGGNRSINLNGADLLDDMSYDEVVDMIDDLERKYRKMNVLEAKIHLHEHDEKLRGTPLVLARIRLYTDKGTFIASDEGYGARHAISLAHNAIERKILKGKTYGESKKHPDEEYWEKIHGWYLSG
jgi:CBS domain-containing protein/ribosome-associated translation inhibitor RaiA